MTECLVLLCFFFFFFKQKTAYEMRISDWSSDVCSSDLRPRLDVGDAGVALVAQRGRLKLDPDVRRLLHDDALLPQRLLEGVEDEAAFQATGAGLVAQGRAAHLQHVATGERTADHPGRRRRARICPPLAPRPAWGGGSPGPRQQDSGKTDHPRPHRKLLTP